MAAVLLALFFCHESFSGSTWIHAVGIDESNVNQNYDTFYYSATAFNKECSSSSEKPVCFLYINDDSALRPKTSNFSEAIQNNRGAPHAEGLKKIISDQVRNAKDGDTIIISLQNHGAPVREKSPACIWLSSNDKICESDISEILKNKPKGVKVFVNADACFSGAFADLSSSEVCTATQANRLEFGYVNRRSFWNAVSERHPQTSKDLAEPIVKESGQQRLLSSQVILQQLCMTARKKISLETVISELSTKDSITNAYKSSDCRDDDMTARKLKIFGKQAFAVLQNRQSCKELELPKVVCDARERLKNKKSEAAKLIQDLDSIAKKELEINVWMQENIAGFSEAANASALQMKKMSPDEIREISDSVNLGRNPDWLKFDQARVGEIKKSWDLVQLFLNKISENSKNSKRVDEILAQLKKGGVYDDLIMLQGCFYENSPQNAIDHSLWLYQRVGKEFFERKFSEKDYEEAKQCELSVRF